MRDKKTLEPLTDHPCQIQLEQPNEDQSWEDFARQKILYDCISGNSYGFKRRNDFDGRIKGLYLYNDGQITPQPGKDHVIENYRYDIGAGDPLSIPKSDMWGMGWPAKDPDAPWKSQSPMIASSRMGDIDKETTRTILSVLRNKPRPGAIVGVKNGGDGGSLPSRDTTEAAKGGMQDNYTGDNRGKPLFINAEALSYQEVGMNLKDMETGALRNVTEQRACSAYLISPIVVGYGAGIQGLTYENFKQAHIQWYMKTMIPLWRQFQSDLTRALAPEYKGFGGDIIITMEFDNIPILGEKTLELYKVAQDAYAAQLLCRRESRAMVGKPDIDDGKDVFYRPLRINLSGDVDPVLSEAIDDENRATPAAKSRINGTVHTNGVSKN